MVPDDDIELLRRKLPFQIAPTNIPGTYTIPAPPRDFDPRTASQRELIRHGILFRKPVDEDDPSLHAAWNRFCSRYSQAKTRVVPQLEPRTGRTQPLKLRPSKESAGLDTLASWAGAVMVGGPWVSVCAVWNVPTVSIPNGQIVGESNLCSDPPEPPVTFPPPGPWQSATWVGLGGFIPVDVVSRTPGTDIIQVGIMQEISATGEVSYQAFYQWYLSNSPSSNTVVTIPNSDGPNDFSVMPGDLISGSVVYMGEQGDFPPLALTQVNLYSDRTKQSISLLVTQINANFTGQSSEWVMEATGPQSMLDDSTFPWFTPVEFGFPVACQAPFVTLPLPPQDAMQPYNIFTDTENSCLDNGQLTKTAIGSNGTITVTCLDE
jgi:hypothetical protein